MNRDRVNKILSPAARFMPLEWLINQSGQKLIFPFYHTVSNDTPLHLKFLYRPKTVKEFSDDLEFLLKNFMPLSPSVMLNQERSSYASKPSFILSFDDGLAEVNEIIAPILLKKGIPAIFFLNNDFLDNTGLFHRFKASIIAQELMNRELTGEVLRMMESRKKLNEKTSGNIVNTILDKNSADNELMDDLAQALGIDFDAYLRLNKPYLSSSQVSDLLKKGFHIGAHSCNHINFSNLSEEAQYAEINKSMEGIRDKFSLNYSFFAFPFSDDAVNNSLLRRVYSSGERFLDAGFGTSGLKKRLNLPHYQRISFEKPLSPAVRILRTHYLYYLLKMIVGKNLDKQSV